MSYVIGVDFGTDSVRSMIVEAGTGRKLISSVFYYPRWKEGLFCDPGSNRFRQHPLDHIEGLVVTIRDCLDKAGIDAREILGIGVDTTGSTPVVVNEAGMPLALCPGFEQNPNAMFVIWKDHTAVAEAIRINEHAAGFERNYLEYVGGIYSAEWYWAKLLHVLRADERVNGAARGFIEHCDWVPYLLTGGKDLRKVRRGVCSAGHKALWSDAWKGLPPADFFSSLDPLLDERFRFDRVYTSDQAAGSLSEEWARRLGLHEGIIVAVGALDAHMGAVGGQIEPYYLSRVMGTSTCDIMVTSQLDHAVRGICGQVDGSVIPGLTGLEAGQSAFGDAYHWWAKTAGLSLEELTEQAILVEVTDRSELALDWLNGRRTPDSDQEVKGAFINLGLATTPASLFRALAEGTCFGARAIIERFETAGLPVKGLIGLGGIAAKSPFVMQLLADVTGKSIRIHASDQTCALGAAMFAATAAGIYPTVMEAMDAMGQGFSHSYLPEPGRKALYDRRYRVYRELGGFAETIKKYN
jgi:L-ribulokinase